jgi:hypothetical protein
MPIPMIGFRTAEFDLAPLKELEMMWIERNDDGERDWDQEIGSRNLRSQAEATQEIWLIWNGGVE